MQVLKFGGSSVANAENIRKIISILEKKVRLDKTIVVVSALGGVTDLLLQCGFSASAGNDLYKKLLSDIEQRHFEVIKSLLPVNQQSGLLALIKRSCNELDDICNSIFQLQELTSRSKDRLVSYGELFSSQVISEAVKITIKNTSWLDSRTVIKTNSEYGNATVDFGTSDLLIRDAVKKSSADLIVMPGFVASDSSNITTTLGRGGSDYTAAILAAAVDAKELEIWTDVSGMMTADPRLVSNAKVISEISYQEAMELSHFGAKVIYPPTIQPARNKNIPIRIKNTFFPDDPGTLIGNTAGKKDTSIRGISSMNNMTLISLEGSGMIGIPGFSKRLFEALSNAKINVILITQSSSEHSICAAIESGFAEKAKLAVDTAFEYEIDSGKVEPLIVENDMAIVALVGDNMKNHQGTSGKMFTAFGRNGVNIRAIAQGSSERNISAVISVNDIRKAINVLHEEFFETSFKQINLFIAGVGNVGSKLIRQLQQQQEFLQEHLHLQVNVVGLANSKQFCIDEGGIELGKWKETLEQSKEKGTENYFKEIIQRNLRNSVLADITANETLAGLYQQLLQKSISVVACNKIAASSSYEYYERVKRAAREFNASFFFETNVGAGLPIISTLSDLRSSGDTIHKIEAVLSGTLNFVFNHYDGKQKFSEVVRTAQQEGYTEPDPRLDLGGTDVMRKIMILAREAGERFEMSDIENTSFMPENCMKGSVEDFYSSMLKEENHFKKLYEGASKEGKKLKFVATYLSKEANGNKKARAFVGLKPVSEEDNLYHLYGKDNVVLFYSDRYKEQPLVVKGAGAGADVTASGVFGNIIRTGTH